MARFYQTAIPQDIDYVRKAPSEFLTLAGEQEALNAGQMGLVTGIKSAYNNLRVFDGTKHIVDDEYNQVSKELDDIVQNVKINGRTPETLARISQIGNRVSKFVNTGIGSSLSNSYSNSVQRYSELKEKIGDERATDWWRKINQDANTYGENYRINPDTPFRDISSNYNAYGSFDHDTYLKEIIDPADHTFTTNFSQSKEGETVRNQLMQTLSGLGLDYQYALRTTTNSGIDLEMVKMASAAKLGLNEDFTKDLLHRFTYQEPVDPETKLPYEDFEKYRKDQINQISNAHAISKTTNSSLVDTKILTDDHASKVNLQERKARLDLENAIELERIKTPSSITVGSNLDGGIVTTSTPKAEAETLKVYQSRLKVAKETFERLSKENAPIEQINAAKQSLINLETAVAETSSRLESQFRIATESIDPSINPELTAILEEVRSQANRENVPFNYQYINQYKNKIEAQDNENSRSTLYEDSGTGTLSSTRKNKRNPLIGKLNSLIEFIESKPVDLQVQGNHYNIPTESENPVDQSFLIAGNSASSLLLNPGLQVLDGNSNPVVLKERGWSNVLSGGVLGQEKEILTPAMLASMIEKEEAKFMGRYTFKNNGDVYGIYTLATGEVVQAQVNKDLLTATAENNLRMSEQYSTKKGVRILDDRTSNVLMSMLEYDQNSRITNAINSSLTPILGRAGNVFADVNIDGINVQGLYAPSPNSNQMILGERMIPDPQDRKYILSGRHAVVNSTSTGSNITESDVNNKALQLSAIDEGLEYIKNIEQTGVSLQSGQTMLVPIKASGTIYKVANVNGKIQFADTGVSANRSLTEAEKAKLISQTRSYIKYQPKE